MLSGCSDNIAQKAQEGGGVSGFLQKCNQYGASDREQNKHSLEFLQQARLTLMQGRGSNDLF